MTSLNFGATPHLICARVVRAPHRICSMPLGHQGICVDGELPFMTQTFASPVFDVGCFAYYAEERPRERTEFANIVAAAGLAVLASKLAPLPNGQIDAETLKDCATKWRRLVLLMHHLVIKTSEEHNYWSPSQFAEWAANLLAAYHIEIAPEMAGPFADRIFQLQGKRQRREHAPSKNGTGR
ncbi:MAG: hypothetical protein HYX68_06765 [Planctomycetes bacterium]|nr:hypothetical protein [Planctomycetota bacterium]